MSEFRPETGRYITSSGKPCFVQCTSNPMTGHEYVRVHYDDGHFTCADFRTFAMWGFTRATEEIPVPALPQPTLP